MGLIKAVVEAFSQWRTKRYVHARDASLKELLKNTRIPWDISVSDDVYPALVHVQHKHLQAMIEACRPRSFTLNFRSVDLGGLLMVLNRLSFNRGPYIEVICSRDSEELPEIPKGYKIKKHSKDWYSGHGEYVCVSEQERTEPGK